VAALGFVIASGERGLAFALVAAQTCGVGWLAQLGYARGGHWVSATFVTAAAWTPMFLVPSWVYVVDPSLLATNSPAQVVALVDLSLFALLAGVLLVRARRGTPVPAPSLEVAEVAEPSRGALIAWAIVGLACLVALMALNGGPIAYVTHQDTSGNLNRGLTYLVWGVLFLRYAPLAAVASRWARGAPATRPMFAALIAGCGIVVVTGARAFIAVAAVQVLLVFALLRRMPRLRSVLGPAVLIGLLLVFGLGGVKRFQAYGHTHPGEQRGFASYMVDVAPREALGAYVNNYVDGVSLIGLARRVVPAQADYEYGKVIVRILLKPLPSPLRPDVSEPAAIRQAFYPAGGGAYAIPLQATAYLEFGLPGIAVAFLAIGALLATVDGRLARQRHRSLGTLLALVTLAVQIPILLRSSLPNGLAFLLIDVIGVWIAALTVAGGPGSLRERARRSLPRRTA
jgi:phosphatidylglycerophosphate synthase